MSGNFAIKGGGVGRLMANAILNFHFDFLNPFLSWCSWSQLTPMTENIGVPLVTWWVSRLPFTLTLKQDLFIRKLFEGICPLKQEIYAKNTGFGWLKRTSEPQNHPCWLGFLCPILFCLNFLENLSTSWSLLSPNLTEHIWPKIGQTVVLTRCSLLYSRRCLNFTKETFLTSATVLNSSQNASGCDTAAVSLLSTPGICIQMEQCLMHIFIFFDFLETAQYNIFRDKQGYIFHLELLQCVFK